MTQQNHQGEVNYAGTNQVPPPVVLMNLLGGIMPARCIYVAAQFHIAELLREGPKGIEQLATETGAYGPYLYRVLRALASIGIFEERERNIFTQTELSSFLLPGVPGSMHDMALLWGAEYQWNSWGDIEHTIRTGEPGMKHVYGTDMWTYLTQVNPAEGEIFSRAMTAMSNAVNEPIVQAYDFSDLPVLVDVGGGHGSLLAAILTRNPSLNGILFDRQSVIKGAEKTFADPCLSGRVHVVAGDFFQDSVPVANAYIMKQIMQDWSDEDCIHILRNCRQAMQSGGHVLVVEQLITDRPESSFAKFFDVQMMVMLAQGRERTEEEYRALYEAAGLRLARVIPTASVYSILEGIAA